MMRQWILQRATHFPRSHCHNQADRHQKWRKRAMFHTYLFVHGALIAFKDVDDVFITVRRIMPAMIQRFQLYPSTMVFWARQVNRPKMQLVDRRRCQFWLRATASQKLFAHIWFLVKALNLLHPEAALVRDIKFLGYTKFIVKSNQEPAILALANAVKNILAPQNIERQLENSPKGDAHGMSNGEAEMSVGQTQGLCRTLKDHREHNIGKQIAPKSPVLGWLIEHAGVLYTLFSFDGRAKDGLTPFRLGRSRAEIGQFHYHRLVSMLTTESGRKTNLLHDGHQIFSSEFERIQRKISLVHPRA